MTSIWLRAELSEEIIKSEEIFKQTQSIISDIMAGRLDVTKLIENMGGVLTNKEAENREKGMRFFTKILKELPRDYLSAVQVKFISQFYIDRLKDNHRVIPAVLDGYLVIIDMKNYDIKSSAEFFTILFREVPCQSQVRQDRYNIYLIIKKILQSNGEYMKSLGPDFIYGVISAIDGERDPRNLMFLFEMLPHFIRTIQLGHLVEEMFEVISCYYPIDFHPSADDPAAVSRQDLANALAPCLCAVPDFGELCLVLLIEKLDSSLRLAKIDSLRLLKESCLTFKPESYGPFLKTLWSSIYREISHKTDEELRMAAHEALSALVKNLSITANTDQAFENYIKGILITMQTALAESTTAAQFTQAVRVLLTTANASKESCIIITKSMIPATLAYYGFNTSPKLQIASLHFLGDLYELAKHWDVLEHLDVQVKEIPQVCLTAVSQPNKEYQIAGFKTLVRVEDVLQSDLIVPFVEVLVYNVQHSHEDDLLTVSVETIHVIARKFPEEIMDLVVRGKCDLNSIISEKTGLQKRLNLLCNLASIDDFTKIIIEEMLNVITSDNNSADQVVKALSESISNTSVYTEQKVTQIDSDHGLVDSVLVWLLKEITQTSSQDSLAHGFMLVSSTVGNLPENKQQMLLDKHTDTLLKLCHDNEIYYSLLEALYVSLRQNVFSPRFSEIMALSLKFCLSSDSDTIRRDACVLIAHFLNKADYGQKFDSLYELLKNHLASCSKDDVELCPKLIQLYGWLTKALILRGSDLFLFWLQKILVAIGSAEYCKYGAEAINLIMADNPESLTIRQHCRISLLYRQRMFQTFSGLTDKMIVESETKEAYLLCWAYILGKLPKSVIHNEVTKITPLVIESLNYENKDLLMVMTDVLSHVVQTNNLTVAGSLQTVLPRLLKVTTYVKSMDVRIKSLQCLYDIANCFPTMILLPHKQDVLLELAPSLDDKKRLVRNMAVRARTRWFLIGAPGEAKEN